MSLKLFGRLFIGGRTSRCSAIHVLSRCNSTSSQLPSDTEKSRSQLSKALTSRIDQFQTSLLFAGQRLNDLTGYSGIEKLKKQIENQEQEVSRTIQLVREAKKAYEEAIRTRSESQREVNELLQRKNTWSGSDLERFTILFRDDHSNSQNEERCQRNLGESELKVDQARTDLGNMILARYHEEQIWSDKIRRASTWGTWGLMVFNIFLFIIVQLGLEPWKRRRLVGSFEDKVRQVVQEERLAAETADKAVDPGLQKGETDDSDFLTDADYAASAHAHETPDSRIPSDHVHDIAVVQTASPESAANHDQPPSITDQQTMQESSGGRIESEPNARPWAGSSALLSLPTSLPALRSSGIYLYRQAMDMLILLQRQAVIHWRRALSPRPSQLRAEDVTAACFASGLFGIGVGLCIRRS